MKVGWSKKTITPKIRDIVMMGYANDQNRARSVSKDLFVRAIWFKEEESQYLLIYLDLCFISRNLHDEITKKINEKLSIPSSSIHLTASHTHSAPGGYGDKLYYEIPTPGFQKEFFDLLVDQVISCANEAREELSDAKITFKEESFPENIPVAFNRSLEAYLCNPEAKGDETFIDAVNRSMYQLNIVKEKKSAVVNWFACHATSMPNTNTAIHFDNKGYACEMIEEYLGEGSLAIFAQGSAGDVSPNFFIYDRTGEHRREDYSDFDQNAKENGGFQFQQSQKIFNGKSEELKGSFFSKKELFKFSELESKDKRKRLGAASFGIPFIRGTKEGSGIPRILAIFLSLFISTVNFLQLISYKAFSNKRYLKLRGFQKIHGKKVVFLNVTDREFLGFKIRKKVPLFLTVEPLLKKLSELLKLNFYQEKESWYEDELPLQIVNFGSLLLVNLPFELTTMSERRVKRSLSEKTEKQIVISCYSNAYAGYITTPEEYDKQCYEGGHTVFGRESLPILIETLEEILKDF